MYTYSLRIISQIQQMFTLYEGFPQGETYHWLIINQNESECDHNVDTVGSVQSRGE